MKEVETVNLEYIPGERIVTQGHKYGERAHRNKHEAYVNPLGFGNATETEPSQLILTVDTEEGRERVRIDQYFKVRGKRLTEKRRNALVEKMPNKVNIEQQVSAYGNSYVSVVDADMDAWSKAAGIK